MIVAGLRFELRVPHANSLKEKRAVIRPLVEGVRRSASVSVSEVAHQDTWQRSAIGVAIVTPDPRSMERLVAIVRRRVEEDPQVELLNTTLEYVEMDR